MIEGVSGLLSCFTEGMVDSWNRSLGELILKNGTIYKGFSADSPNRLRGPQFHRAWVDELCAFQYPEAFDMLEFGLRLGVNPQCIITTTPKPTLQLKELIARKVMHPKEVLITTGKTFDNAANLAASTLRKLKSKYEGTRLGRQELDAEILDDAPGALWRRVQIDDTRVTVAPEMKRIIVAIDPAISTGENSDETGIVVAGKSDNPTGMQGDDHAYVLADRSGKYTPDEWAREAVAQYHLWKADCIVAEANQGGDMVENTIRQIDRSVPVKLVHASKGKAIRAEPVSALYEQNRVHHVGSHPTLEDQMCIFTIDFDRAKMKFSPDRLDALVWAITELAVLGLPGQNFLDYYALLQNRENARQPRGEITRLT